MRKATHHTMKDKLKVSNCDRKVVSSCEFCQE